jgi:16S rRNA (guanine527-N7)-methyltransferase
VFADFPLSAEQERALAAHLEMLLRWNQKLNLTAIRNREEAIQRHYCESLFLGMHLPPGAWTIADVGSGAGFPGFPVAVLRPDCQVTLIESHQRKAVFLRESSRKQPNIRVLARRAEDVTEQFDRVISRAVSYEDLASCLQNLAPAADLLTGVEEPPLEVGFVWEAPVLLPWGKQRFLRTGVEFHVKQSSG